MRWTTSEKGCQDARVDVVFVNSISEEGHRENVNASAHCCLPMLRAPHPRQWKTKPRTGPVILPRAAHVCHELELATERARLIF